MIRFFAEDVGISQFVEVLGDYSCYYPGFDSLFFCLLHGKTGAIGHALTYTFD